MTNRCNLTCPVCFANANAAGYLYEPDMEQVRTMLMALRNERPVDGRVVQFSGGEPTIHPKFIEILAMANGDGLHPPAGGDQRNPDRRQPGVCQEVQGSRTGNLVSAVRRRQRRHLPEDARRGAVRHEDAVHRELPQGGNEDRVCADDREGAERSSARRHSEGGHRQRGHGQRHQLPAGGVYRTHLQEGAGGQALHPDRSGVLP